MSGTPRRISRWLADSLRLVVAFGYWNLRKSAYVARGRTGRCPCQNPSDDDIPGRVRCDAVAHWRNPARFRVVCPLLVRNEAAREWCCAVDHRGVRPFWGRAAAWAAGALAAAYVAGVLAVLVFLRFVADTPVGLVQVAWPPRWPEIRRVQADAFYGRAMAAFREGRLSEAHLALVSARARFPDHYGASLLLGQIALFRGGFLFGDEYFAGLLASNPERRFQTAVTYHDTLLALGRLEVLAAFALRMAGEDRDRAAFWVRTLVLVLRRHPDAGRFAGQHREELARLAPQARLLVEAEVRLAAADRGTAVDRLRTPFHEPLNPTYMLLQVERLAELGRGGDAQVLLDFYGPALGAFETGLAQYTIERAGRDAFFARATLRRLLAAPLSERQVMLLAERLVRWPDAADSAALGAAVSAQPPLAAARVAAPLWLAAVVSGNPAEAAAWRERARRVERTELPDLERVDFRSRDFQDPASPLFLSSAVDLPREVVLALALRAAEAAAARAP